MTYVIFDPENMKIFARYTNENIAHRMLNNAINKGHRIGGRRWQRVTLEKLVIGTMEQFRAMDYNVVVKNLMSDKPVIIRRSQEGTCVDPSTETYWSM